MAHDQGGIDSTGIGERWRALAERRLNHLVRMFETGRWRWYHRSEAAFLEDIKEARDAVEMWRALAATLPPPVSLGSEVLGRSLKLSWREHLQNEFTKVTDTEDPERGLEQSAQNEAEAGEDAAATEGSEPVIDRTKSRYPFLKNTM